MSTESRRRHSTAEPNRAFLAGGRGRQHRARAPRAEPLDLARTPPRGLLGAPLGVLCAAERPREVQPAGAPALAQPHLSDAGLRESLYIKTRVCATHTPKYLPPAFLHVHVYLATEVPTCIHNLAVAVCVPPTPQPARTPLHPPVRSPAPLSAPQCSLCKVTPRRAPRYAAPGAHAAQGGAAQRQGRSRARRRRAARPPRRRAVPLREGTHS